MSKFTKQDLLSVISSYQAAVSQAVNWLRQKDFSNIVVAIERSGYIDYEQKISYTFHGGGCLVVMNDVEVDFNFGYNGRIDGFDLGFVHQFYEQTVPDQDQKVSHLEMLKLADELLQEGVIIEPLVNLGNDTPYFDGLYYLPSDWQNPNPPSFQLVCKQFEDLTGVSNTSV